MDKPEFIKRLNKEEYGIIETDTGDYKIYLDYGILKVAEYKPEEKKQ